ncbi:alkaline phosphatase family protein [Paenibacillus sp. MBLB4367]|uniref:alkaline phosphatase family protein n=1 Tax=Paenibacillus sp. MBLB4367 TaxID=3384767 RepID=UPI0039083398
MQAKNNRVFVIGMDGAGNFIKDTETPNIHAICRNGVLTYDAQTAFPSISAQCWGALHHSVDPQRHGLDNDIVSDRSRKFPEDSPYPSFLKLIRQAYPESKLAAFSEWWPINHGIIEASAEVHQVSLPDDELAVAAAAYIRENPDVKAMFIEFSNPDYAGHKHAYGTDSKPYLECITETDRLVGIVLDAIQEAGLLEGSLIIFTTDHGGGGAHTNGHGSDDPRDMTIFWGCVGQGIAPGAALKEPVRIIDTAPVIAYALGLTPPREWEGRVPAGLFENQ